MNDQNKAEELIENIVENRAKFFGLAIIFTIANSISTSFVTDDALENYTSAKVNDIEYSITSPHTVEATYADGNSTLYNFFEQSALSIKKIDDDTGVADSNEFKYLAQKPITGAKNIGCEIAVESIAREQTILQTIAFNDTTGDMKEKARAFQANYCPK